MADLFTYLDDGANYQAKAVVAYLGRVEGIDESYDPTTNMFLANPKVARFENCREQGYVVYLRGADYIQQINLVVFEHRNSDSIVVIKWFGTSLNAPTLASIPQEHPWLNNKHYNDALFDYGKAEEAATFIMNELTEFWIETGENDD